jgi:serine/threonine protein kinase
MVERRLHFLRSALLLLLLWWPSRLTWASSSSLLAQRNDGKSFLLLCLTDGSLVTMDAWTGRLESRIVTDPLLQKNTDNTARSADVDRTDIVPGLDGRLYAYNHNNANDAAYPPQLQELPLTIHSILEHPVRSCPEGSEDCGILTATAETSLLALNDRGKLLWKSQLEDKRDTVYQPTLLLQRRDYWVQHVSIATGQQAWNVSLGTYQALDFAPEPDDELVLDDDDQDDNDPIPRKQSDLPAILFSNSGHTLSAIDPHNGNVLWQQTTSSVLSSVFGIYHGQWKILTVLENPNDQDMDTAPILDEYALTTRGREDKSWSEAAWEAARLQYKRRESYFSYRPQKLLPAPQECVSEDCVTQQEQQCLSGDCRSRLTQQCLSGDCNGLPEFLLPPAFTPRTNSGSTVQPGGLLLSWRLVEYLLVFVVLLGVGLWQWYLSKKRKWLQESKATSATTVGYSTTERTLLASHSLEASISSDSAVQGRFRRCASMPETNIATPQFRTKSDPGDPLLLDRNSSHTSSPCDLKQEVVPSGEKDLKEELPSVMQHYGIPLVRYSRYASEFEEMEAMGKGGFGTVFRGKNVLDGREYAVKKVSIQGAVGDTSFQTRLQRVLREVKILAVLDHPNIVRYYTAWLEMEKEEDAPKCSSKDTFGDETGMSRRYSSSLMMTDSVSQWEPDSPARPVYGGPRYSAPPNPLGWDNMFEESAASLRRNLRRDYSDFSFLEESNDDFIGSKNDTTRNVEEDTGDSETNHIADASNGRPSTNNEGPPTYSIRHTLYIQMQLCSQHTISEFLLDETSRRGSAESGIDIPAALQLFLQISQAVHYVHQQGLIHRDLKPSNCFMDSSGNIKVGDFGLSREAASESETSLLNISVSGRNSIINSIGTDGHTSGVGTRSYASPEQTNASDYDSSTDVSVL